MFEVALLERSIHIYLIWTRSKYFVPRKIFQVQKQLDVNVNVIFLLYNLTTTRFLYLYRCKSLITYQAIAKLILILISLCSYAGTIASLPLMSQCYSVIVVQC